MDESIVFRCDVRYRQRKFTFAISSSDEFLVFTCINIVMQIWSFRPTNSRTIRILRWWWRWRCRTKQNLLSIIRHIQCNRWKHLQVWMLLVVGFQQNRVRPGVVDRSRNNRSFAEAATSSVVVETYINKLVSWRPVRRHPWHIHADRSRRSGAD